MADWVRGLAVNMTTLGLPVLGYPTLPAAALAGKTVLDAGNYCPGRDGHIEALDGGR